MDWMLLAEIIAVLLVLTAIAGFVARQLYRYDSNRIASHLNLKISFFGRVRGEYKHCDLTIEPRNPIKIMVRYRPTEVSPAIMDVNMWLLRKGMPLPADATAADNPTQHPQHVASLDPIFDRSLDVWSHPPELATLVFANKQKLGSRIAKSNLQQIELNWLFPGLSCFTDLGVKGVDVNQLQRNVDLVVEVAELIRNEANGFLATTNATPLNEA